MRWLRGSRARLAQVRVPISRRWTALAADGVLLTLLVAAAVALGLQPTLVGGVELALSPLDRLIVGGAVLVAIGQVAQARLTLEPRAAGRIAWSTIAAGVLVLLTAAVRGAPIVAAVLAALVPLVMLPGVFPCRPNGRGRDGALGLLVVATLAVLAALALGLVLEQLAQTFDPRMARVALVLVVLHAALLSGFVPGHLWALGIASETAGGAAPLLGLAGALGLGSLAATASLTTLLEHSPGLLAMAGVRPVVLGLGLLGVVLGGVAALGETRPTRMAMHFAAVSAGASLAALGAATIGPTAIAAALGGLIVRGPLLFAALLAASATLPMHVSGRMPVPARLLRGGMLPFWLAIAGLAALPGTAGFAPRWLALAVLAADWPFAAVTLLAVGGLTLLGIRRLIVVRLAAPVLLAPETHGSGAPGRGSLVTPAVFAILIVVLGMYPAPWVDLLISAAAPLVVE